MYDELLLNEKVLMPKQASEFNGDFNIANEFIWLRDKLNIKNVIELGTCVGGSTKWMAQNFENVFTVEINAEFRDIALKRINDYNKNVTSFLGSSINFLPVMLQMCEGNILTYIDSHWQELPLFDELKIIKESGLKPIIVIHDCKVPNEPNLGFDSYNGVDISYENIKPYIEDIYGVDCYDYYYNSDATSTEIKRGVIYITPKK